jgi:hypothetical protein
MPPAINCEYNEREEHKMRWRRMRGRSRTNRNVMDSYSL